MFQLFRPERNGINNPDAYINNAYLFLLHMLGIEYIHSNTILKSKNATLFKDVFSLKESQDTTLKKMWSL